MTLHGMITINVRCSFDCWHGRNVPKRSTHDKWSKNCLPFRSIRIHPRLLVGLVLLDHEFCVVFCISLVVFLFLYFWPLCCLFCFPCTFDHCDVYSVFLVLLTIVLSILFQLTDSNFHFDIFKLFLQQCTKQMTPEAHTTTQH